MKRKPARKAKASARRAVVPVAPPLSPASTRSLKEKLIALQEENDQLTNFIIDRIVLKKTS